jgi:hypothetical protein
MNFGGFWPVFTLFFRMLWVDPDYIHTMLAALQRGISLFEGKVLDSVHVCLLCLSMDIPRVQHFQLWSQHCLSCRSETHVPPIICSPKATFDILKGSYLLYQFKQNLIHTHSSCRSAIFCVHQNCRLSNTHLFLTQYYLQSFVLQPFSE